MLPVSYLLNIKHSAQAVKQHSRHPHLQAGNASPLMLQNRLSLRGLPLEGSAGSLPLSWPHKCASGSGLLDWRTLRYHRPPAIDAATASAVRAPPTAQIHGEEDLPWDGSTTPADDTVEAVWFQKTLASTMIDSRGQQPHIMDGPAVDA